MNDNFSDTPSENEINYVRALSRPSIIKAYSNWNQLSDIERFLLNLYIKSDSKIIDLGCGTGRIVRTIELNTKNYLGIDCSLEMICAAQELSPNYKFICEDILNPSNHGETYDVVLLMNNVIDMLHPHDRREAAFKLFEKYLKPDGTLIYSSHLLANNSRAGYFEENYHGAIVNTYRASFSQLCEEAEKNGLEIKMAARDYRIQNADWLYIAAKTRLTS